MKKLLLLSLIFVLCFVGDAGEKKKKDSYISITEASKLKKYNKNAVWRKVRCKRCNGTGSETKRKYNASKNKMIKWQVPCVRCGGKGTKGMSKM